MSSKTHHECDSCGHAYSDRYVNKVEADGEILVLCHSCQDDEEREPDNAYRQHLRDSLPTLNELIWLAVND